MSDMWCFGLEYGSSSVYDRELASPPGGSGGSILALHTAASSLLHSTGSALTSFDGKHRAPGTNLRGYFKL